MYDMYIFVRKWPFVYSAGLFIAERNLPLPMIRKCHNDYINMSRKYENLIILVHFCFDVAYNANHFFIICKDDLFRKHNSKSLLCVCQK